MLPTKLLVNEARFCDKEKGFRAMSFESIANLPWPPSPGSCADPDWHLDWFVWCLLNLAHDDGLLLRVSCSAKHTNLNGTGLSLCSSHCQFFVGPWLGYAWVRKTPKTEYWGSGEITTNKNILQHVKMVDAETDKIEAFLGFCSLQCWSSVGWCLLLNVSVNVFNGKNGDPGRTPRADHPIRPKVLRHRSPWNVSRCMSYLGRARYRKGRSRNPSPAEPCPWAWISMDYGTVLVFGSSHGMYSGCIFNIFSVRKRGWRRSWEVCLH